MLKKNGLINEIEDRTGYPVAVVRAVLNTAAEVVKEALSGGHSVFLFGLGKLYVKKRAERPARNIHTGERLVVPEHQVVLYQPSSSTTRAVNGDQ